MDVDDILQIARLWQRILNTDREALFGTQFNRLRNQNLGDAIAQPGYVGERYDQTRIMFVGMNPGVGPQEGLGPENLRQFEALQNLREAEEDNLVAAFIELTNVLTTIMPTWRIFQNFVEPILNCANLDFTEVAYLNLLKWRTERRNKSFNSLYDISWNAHTREQIEVLSPRIVIAIGISAGRAFRRHHVADIHVDEIRRVFNNVGPSGREAIARICEWLRANPIELGENRNI